MSRSSKRSQDAPQNISDREPADDVLGEGEDVRANSRTVNGYVGEEVVPGEGDGMEGDEMDDIAEEEELQVDQVEDSESTSPTGTDSLTWIAWYCSLSGHEFFAEVSEDFIEDDFNLTGLAALVPFYKEALEMILDVEPEEESLRVPDVSIVESSAELVYGLIHQRYIITRQGLTAMFEKYESSHFGYCPRVYCQSTKVLPCGRSDLPGVDTVKLFCPNCLDVYNPPSSRFNGVDGAFFGTTFPHLFLKTFKDQLPPLNTSSGPSPTASPAPSPGPSSSAGPSTTTASTSASKIYIPRIYGFKVSERARNGPRMGWLRMRPRDESELERVDSTGRWKYRDGDGYGRDDEGGDDGLGNGRGVRGPGEKFGDDDDLIDEDEEEEEEDEGAAATAPKGGAGASKAGKRAADDLASLDDRPISSKGPRDGSSIRTGPKPLQESSRNQDHSRAPRGGNDGKDEKGKRSLGSTVTDGLRAMLEGVVPGSKTLNVDVSDKRTAAYGVD